jgi:hypothetical protein
MNAAVLALDDDRHSTHDAPRDLLLPVMLTGVAVLGAIGFVGSFTNVAAVAAADNWDRPYLLPLSIDGAIAFFTGLDFALARDRRKVSWLRWFAWALIAVTIALNVAGKTTLFGILGHAALPALFAAAVEAAKATMSARAVETPDTIPLARWLCAPWPTLRLWRRMRVWGITSYAAGLDLERRRVLARIVDRHGSLGEAPARRRELYRLISAAAGIDPDAEVTNEPEPEPAEVADSPAPQPVARRRTPVKRTAPTKVTDDQLADVAVALAAKDPSVLGNWKALAEALRGRGHRLGTPRAQTVLDLARSRAKETADA